MEVIGSGPRVADVVADGEVAGLTLSESVLNNLFQRDPVLGVQLLRNIVNNLAEKLATTDQALAARLAHETRRRV